MAKEEARTRLIKANVRFVYWIARKVAWKCRRAHDENFIHELYEAGYDALCRAIEECREEKVNCPEKFRLISYASHWIRGAIYRQAELELSDSQRIQPTSYDDRFPWLSTTAEESPAGARAKHNGTPFLAVDDAITNPPYMALIEQQDEDIVEQRLPALLAGLTPDQRRVFIEIARQIMAAEQAVDQESPESPQKGTKKCAQPHKITDATLATSMGKVRSAVTRIRPRIKKGLVENFEEPLPYKEILPILRYFLEQLRQGRYDGGTPYA